MQKILSSLISFIIMLSFTSCTMKQTPLQDNEFIHDRILTKNHTFIELIDDNQISIHTNEKHTTKKRITKKDRIYAFALSPDEKFLALAFKQNKTLNISLYIYATMTQITIFPSPLNFVSQLAFSSDNKYLIAASTNNINIYDIQTLKQKKSFKASNPHAITMLKEKNGYKILSAGFDKKVSLHKFDTKTNEVKLIKEYNLPYRLKYLSYNDQKEEIVVCGESYEAKVFDLDLNLIQTLQLAFIPHRLRLSQDKKRLFIAGGRYSSYAKSYKTSDYTSPY